MRLSSTSLLAALALVALSAAVAVPQGAAPAVPVPNRPANDNSAAPANTHYVDTATQILLSAIATRAPLKSPVFLGTVTASALAVNGRMTATPAVPNWATLRAPYDGHVVNIGGVTVNQAWPGGPTYGTVSAITGAVAIPPAAESNVIDGATPGLIIVSGIQGLVTSQSTVQPAVGVYGTARCAVERCRLWHVNGTLANFNLSGVNPPAHGYNGQFTGYEGDYTLRTPVGGWSGTNIEGISLPLDADTQPDGQVVAVAVGKYGAAPWKVGFKTRHAGASVFAEIGKLAETGRSAGQPIYAISNDGVSERASTLQADPDGGFAMQPVTGGRSRFVLRSTDGGASAETIEFGSSYAGLSSPTKTVGSLGYAPDGAGGRAVVSVSGGDGVQYEVLRANSNLRVGIRNAAPLYTLDVGGPINGTGYNVAGASGVSCSGPPTENFQVTNGIITRC